MAYLVPVDDPGDPRLAPYLNLRDVQLRTSLEAEHGLFIAEGEKVIRRAVRAGYPLLSVLAQRRWLDPLADVLDHIDVPAYVADAEMTERITGFHVHRGALAAMARVELPSPQRVTRAARRLVVCEDITDHTNVGAIFRCAAALGVGGILLAPRCADPLYRRAVRVSMGSVFSVPYARLDDWYGGLAQLRAEGFHVVALTPDPSAVPLESALAGAGERCALVLGGEGHGLSGRWLGEADVLAGIPMSREVDSLNVTASAAIACYLLTRGG